MLPKEPGQSATVLVALAEIGGSPSQTSAGNVNSVPPPAIELTAPARSAAVKTSSSPVADTRVRVYPPSPKATADKSKRELIARGLIDQSRSSGVRTPSFFTASRIGRGAPCFGNVTSTHSSSPGARTDGSGTCSGMKNASG